ncbi:MAG: hypothetical protein QOK28_1645 [Actinomycetota bacterium]|jgi:acetyltransferase-like isoleucine patch superfamily enzyme
MSDASNTPADGPPRWEAGAPAAEAIVPTLRRFEKLRIRVFRSLRNRRRFRVRQARGAIFRGLNRGLLKGGRGLQFGRGVDLDLYGELIVGEGVVLSDGVAIEVGPHGSLVIGDDVFIGRHTVIAAADHITIGSHVLIAEHCSIRDGDHAETADARKTETRMRTQPVTIGDGSWIGAGCRILRGTELGRGVTVAANSVVRSTFPSDALVGGIPAARLR